jgi:hypothetical protein
MAWDRADETETRPRERLDANATAPRPVPPSAGADARAQLRIGSRLSWAVAWPLAVAAPVVYLLSPNGVTWWIGLLLPMPLVGLAVWREDHKRGTDDYVGAPDGSTPSPPADGGGM